MGDIFFVLFIQPITNLLLFFYQLFTAVNFPYALGFAIVALTVFVRLLIYPFASAQIKSSMQMQKLSPHMARIKERYKHDKKRQQEEMMKLYKEHGVNPAAGCLPMIIQIPVIWSLYTVLIGAVAANSIQAINKINEALYFPYLKLTSVWSAYFFGFPLFDAPSKLFASHPLIVLIPVVTGIFQLILSKMMMPASGGVDSKVKKSQPAGGTADFQTAFQSQALIIFPVMIGVFSYTLPLGLSLYWNTLTIFGILQQYLLGGLGGLKPWIEKVKLVSSK
ncbi:membrane protein insertase YidC [Candidatus Parcubacteria bacterium]|nr:MAG: membrane protein insertase YidC [Candidatus Parcubacteria bacterium]